MSRAPRLLIIDGYTREARDELVAAGVSVAAVQPIDVHAVRSPKSTIGRDLEVVVEQRRADPSSRRGTMVFTRIPLASI